MCIQLSKVKLATPPTPPISSPLLHFHSLRERRHDTEGRVHGASPSLHGAQDLQQSHMPLCSGERERERETATTKQLQHSFNQLAS